MNLGYGKTASWWLLLLKGNFDSVLIICPASIKSTWKKELLWYVLSEILTIIEGYSR